MQPVPAVKPPTTGDSFSDRPVVRRLYRSRSMEELSTEQLHSTADDTVVIFLEYVRNKASARATGDCNVAEIGRERISGSRKSKRTTAVRQKKESLRRLQSEPHGTADERPPDADGKHDGTLVKGNANSDRTQLHVDIDTTSRPHCLLLEPPPSSKAERRRRGQRKQTLTPKRHPAKHESPARNGSHAATPVPDPPLGLSPCSSDHSGFLATYPPLNVTVHRPRSVSYPSPAGPQVVAGDPIRQTHLCNGQKHDSALSRKHQAKIIAEKLKMYGDDLTDTRSDEELRILSQMLEGSNPEELITFFSGQLRQMLNGLSWQSIGKIFHLSYHIIELLTTILGPSEDIQSHGSREWQHFSELWDDTLRAITRWIWRHGGWGAFLADNTGTLPPSPKDRTCPATPSFRRVRSRLLSLSESGEFVDEEGNPHNAGETTYISSPENGSFNGTGARDSSVDQPESPASEVTCGQASPPSVPPCLPATLTPASVTPPCSSCMNGEKVASCVHVQSAPTCINSQTAVNGSALKFASPSQVHSLSLHAATESLKRRSQEISEEEEEEEEEREGQLNRSVSLPASAIRRSSARRASETAFNGIVLGVSAACVYAAVSALMRH